MHQWFSNIELTTDRAISWLSRRNLFQQVILELFLSFMIGMSADIFFGQLLVRPGGEVSFFIQLIFIGIAFPLLETFIFHFLAIRLVNKYISVSKTPAILISAVFFGLQHGYSNAYIVAVSINGIYYAGLYYANKKTNKNIIVRIWVVHAVNNLTPVLALELEKHFQ